MNAWYTERKILLALVTAADRLAGARHKRECHTHVCQRADTIREPLVLAKTPTGVHHLRRSLLHPLFRQHTVRCEASAGPRRSSCEPRNEGWTIRQYISSVWGSLTRMLRGFSEASSGSEVDGRSGDPSDYYQEVNEFADLQVFSGTNGCRLSEEICSKLDMSLGRTRHVNFADGETFVQIIDEVRGKDVYICQTVPGGLAGSTALHNAIMELFLLVTAIRRASAKRITVVLPYMPYFRQNAPVNEESEKSTRIRPHAAADVAMLLAALGVDRVLCIDMHSERIEGYFSKVMPVTNLSAHGLAAQYFKKKNLTDPVVCAPSVDGGERAKSFWNVLRKALRGHAETTLATLISDRAQQCHSEDRVQQPVAFVNFMEREGLHKATEDDNETEPTKANYVIGEVKGRDVILVDDLIDTAERAVSAAKVLKNAGARRIFIYATHGIFSKGALDRITRSPLEEVVVTNSVPLASQSMSEKITILSLGKLLAEAIKRIHLNSALDQLHKDMRQTQERLEEERRQ